MASQFNVGDRVRRKNLLGEGRAVGVLQKLAFGITWRVFNQESDRVEQWTENYFEPVHPAPSPTAMTQPEPACSAKVCGAECAELRARHRELKSELLEAQDQIAALGEEREALRGELGDTRGERDSWRIRAERAEKGLDLMRGRK